jgi:predicted Zn-dependent protease with MMP-like domain
VKISDKDFQVATKEAVDSLPPVIREKLKNTVFDLQDDMTPEQIKEFGGDLLGLYHGTPYGDRGQGDPPMPDRITLFKRPILEEAEDRDHLIEIIQDTVLHEIGHWLGLEDDELEEMGL